MMTKEGSTLIVNFMTAEEGVHVPERDHISHITCKIFNYLRFPFSTPSHRLAKLRV